jgi:electron transport complex protein RnfE
MAENELKPSKKQIFLAGLFSENPTLSIVLGMCPVIVATTSIMNTVAMSFAVIFVLFFSNTIISALRKVIPSEIRIPVYIVIIASLVTAVQMLMEAYTPELAESLGLFLPLITVNCIILGRAEAFANKNTVTDSMLDALGESLGFFMACMLIAIPRELLGTGGFTFSNPFNVSQSVSWLPLSAIKIPLMDQAVGGFLWIGIIMGLFKMALDKHNTKAALKTAQLQEQAQAAAPVKAN